MNIGSVIDGPAWLDMKIKQDEKKVAAGISCTRSCASISGSVAAGGQGDGLAT